MTVKCLKTTAEWLIYKVIELFILMVAVLLVVILTIMDRKFDP